MIPIQEGADAPDDNAHHRSGIPQVPAETTHDGTIRPSLFFGPQDKVAREPGEPSDICNTWQHMVMLGGSRGPRVSEEGLTTFT